jgi:O-antigen/teichoic acid export membrane protein
VSDTAIPADTKSSARELRRDVSVSGAATVIGAALGVLQVFLLPKLLDVRTFGLYRIFVLYSSYIGLLHFGAADGALLRWAGNPLTRIAGEWRTLSRWMYALQLILMAAAFATAAALARRAPDASVILIALGCWAVVSNPLIVSQYAFQAARDFTRVGVITILVPAVFVAGVVALPARYRSLPEVLAFYILGQAAAAAVSLAPIWRAGRHASDSPLLPPMRINSLLRVGAPLTAANVVTGLSQTIDRLFVSWTAPVTLFAQYSFASSVFFAASIGNQALSKVSLPHVSAARIPDRPALLAHFADILLCGYAAGLAAYPSFEAIIAAFLPAYRPALPIMRAMLTGALFLVATQVVVNTGLQAAGRVTTQLFAAVGAAVAVGILTGAAILAHAPLWAVAAAGSAGLALGWALALIATYRVARTHVPARSLGFAASGLAVAAVAIGATMSFGPALATVIYVAVAFPIVLPAALRLRRWHDTPAPAHPESFPAKPVGMGQ